MVDLPYKKIYVVFFRSCAIVLVEIFHIGFYVGWMLHLGAHVCKPHRVLSLKVLSIDLRSYVKHVQGNIYPYIPYLAFA